MDINFLISPCVFFQNQLITEGFRQIIVDNLPLGYRKCDLLFFLQSIQKFFHGLIHIPALYKLFINMGMDLVHQKNSRKIL